MCKLIITSILLNVLMYCNAVYLGEQANYYKPKLERNNILNKGLWMKDKVEKSHYGDFIFRADSGDVDNLLQNNFDAFGQNYMDSIPVFSSYVERNKRSAINQQNQKNTKGVRKCKDKINCLANDDEKQSLFKSKYIPQLRPASVFNDYPYEVALLLANSNKREINIHSSTKTDWPVTTDSNIHFEENNNNKLTEQNKTEFKQFDETATMSYNKSAFNMPKRRMTQPNFEYDVDKKAQRIEVSNKTAHIDGSKINRNVFDKEERIWQSAPIQNTLVIPKPESSVKNKPVTERGLVKILTLLTKTFRKVMKQHNEIQEIDNKLHSLNEDFMKNVAVLDTKFQEFETKYAHIEEIKEELQHLNEKFTKKNYDIEHKETVMSKNLAEFESQQKKFLAQQHQFYTIQKYMLEQNEKINRKQSLIAKTQSEISHRQNNFARVFKKAKQFYTNNNFLTGSKLTSVLKKPKNTTNIQEDDKNKVTRTTPTTPVSTDSVKINLFSIPNIGPLLNHDKLILDEKNDQPVDDLVYKYYFNNTFIDNLMKSKVLTAVIDNESKNTRNTKSKRNDLNNETTILLPVGNVNVSPINLRRERRWIRRPSKVSTRFHGKEASIKEKVRGGVNQDNKNKDDPFFTMATNFCIQVGQNQHEQMLNWCVEKSLRKLKSIDMILPMKPLARPPLGNVAEKLLSLRPKEMIKLFPFKTTTKVVEPTFSSTVPMVTAETLTITPKNALDNEKGQDLFFPDNDELESNLKQYELKPDTEGTVYYDGSLHTSDIVISESDALSDIMPGLDSNSHVDVDPLALDLQARRRAYVRRLNENILKRMRT